jgi:endonuclease YncB( thermonuclease family)
LETDLTPPELRAHGLSARHLNYLFGCLFGFPFLMGLILAYQAYQPSFGGLLEQGKEKPQALSAPAQQEPPAVFEAILNPPWRVPRELEDFDKQDNFGARFTGLEQKKLTALLDLPKLESEIPTASLPEMPASAVSYGEFVKDMKLGAPGEQQFAWNRPIAIGENIAGRAEVIDAVTLSISSRQLRLAGLEPPEEGRLCVLLSGEKGDCRKAAAEQLGFFLRWRSVSCAVEKQGEAGEALAECHVGESDIGEWLVRRGWVLPDANKAAGRYRAALIFAQSYKLGLWRQ